MLYFAAFVIMIYLAKGESSQDDPGAILLSQVESNFGECLGIVYALGDFDYDFHESRRRDVAINARKKLTVCGQLAKVSATFSRDYFVLSRGVLGILQPSESWFLKNLMRKVNKKMGAILYVASVDGDASSKFHSLCDDQGPTIVVAETTAGVILGGFTDVSWQSKSNWHSSSTSFLFQIRPAMKSFGVLKNENGYAVLSHPHNGPSFGRAHDLHISSNAMSNSYSCVQRSSYATSSDHELNNGKRTFTVKDYVVLKAVSL